MLSPRLSEACDESRRIALALGGVQLSCGLEVIPAEYAREVFHFGLVEVCAPPPPRLLLPPCVLSVLHARRQQGGHMAPALAYSRGDAGCF